jgi:predicted unusual protein kinase regulating ubiquinone biosynthesis (AarF/ABC1/UbiB family)
MIKLPLCYLLTLSQILFAFVSAVAKMQISKRSQLTADATYSSGNSSNGFDASQYTVGQLLKEMFLDLGPTFVKGQIVMLDRFKTRW